MKLNKYIWLATLPMLFTACQEDALVENHQGLEGKFVLKASVDNEGSFSRAQIKLEEQEDGGKYGAFQWDEGDGFRMFEIVTDEEWNESVGSTHDFTISGYSNSSPSTSATFVSETTPTDGNRFYAYYPSINVNSDSETITLTLNQNLTDNSADSWKEYFNKNMHMMAEGQITGTGTILRFRHQCGLINVSYTNESSTSKYIKGISLDGDWAVSKTMKLLCPGCDETGNLAENGYGISFEESVEVASGNTENFFILFINPSWISDDVLKRMSQLTIQYTDEANSSTTLSTDKYTVGMPIFYNGDGYRLNVKETREGKLIWAKAPELDGTLVSTPAQLLAALEGDGEKKVALSTNISLESTLMIDKNVTIDLAGHKLTYDDNKKSAFSTEDALIVVKRGGNLTINDASNGTGVIDADDLETMIKMVSSTDSKESDIKAVLTINGGHLHGHDVIAGTKGYGNTEITINGGYLNGGCKDGIGIYHPQSGVLNMTNGEIKGNQSAVEMGAGTLNMTGGCIFQNMSGKALYISQGSDNLSLGVDISGSASIEAWGDNGWQGAYAIYEEDLYDNDTENVTINIEGTEDESLKIGGLVYSENKTEFIGSHTRFNNPSCLSYLASNPVDIQINCEYGYDYSGPAVNIPSTVASDSEEKQHSVTINLNDITWTIESGNEDKVYFNVGENNFLHIDGGTINVPDDELTIGGTLFKAENAILDLNRINIDSHRLHAAISVENGECRLYDSTVTTAEGCSAFKVLSDDLNVISLGITNSEISGNFEVDLEEGTEPGTEMRSVLSMRNSSVDGHLYLSENVSAVIRGDENVEEEYAHMFHRLFSFSSTTFVEGSMGWNWGETVPDQNLPEPLPETMITDLAWIAVLEQSLANCEDLEGEFVKTDAGYLDVAHETNSALISQMYVISVDGSEITELKFIDRFTSLATLSIRNSKLTSLDLSKNTSLQSLDCAHNALTSLNVEGCVSLMEINCSDNNLTSLDVSSNTQLTKLKCGGNSNLASLSLNSGLKEFYLEADNEQTSMKSNSALTEIDLSECTSLEKVSLMYNQYLKDIDLSGLTSLTDLNLSYTPIEEIDLEDNTALGCLIASNTENLKTLDLSKNTSLTEIQIENSGITSLDLSKNIWLRTIYCENSHLSVLDLSTMESDTFEYIYCGFQKDANDNDQELKLILNSRWKSKWDNENWGTRDANTNVNCFIDTNKTTGGSDFNIEKIW